METSGGRKLIVCLGAEGGEMGGLGWGVCDCWILMVRVIESGFKC